MGFFKPEGETVAPQSEAEINALQKELADVQLGIENIGSFPNEPHRDDGKNLDALLTQEAGLMNELAKLGVQTQSAFNPKQKVEPKEGEEYLPPSLRQGGILN